MDFALTAYSMNPGFQEQRRRTTPLFNPSGEYPLILSGTLKCRGDEIKLQAPAKVTNMGSETTIVVSVLVHGVSFTPGWKELRAYLGPEQVLGKSENFNTDPKMREESYLEPVFMPRA